VKRREFITLLGGATVTWPLAARAQQPTIGFLHLGSPDSSEVPMRLRAFHQGLGTHGYFEGQNVAVEYRWAKGQNDQVEKLAADLVSRHVSVIMAVSDASALAARSATTVIPVVFVGGNDPVNIGLVTSLNRPGGNLTGVTVLNVEIAAKRLQVLNELIPATTSIAALLDRTAPNFETDSTNLLTAAKHIGLQVHILEASNPNEIDLAFETLVQRQWGPLVIGPSPLFNGQSRQLASLTARYAVPAIFQTREFVTAGGLMSYGGSIVDAYRLAGGFIGRILRGEKPADLPVQQVTKFEFFINLKTAKALGLEIPPTLLARADEVIE
jgi:ABC-type uncharacterized transport system substrate-binding protein